MSRKALSALILLAGCASPVRLPAPVPDPPVPWRVATRGKLAVLEPDRRLLAHFEVRCSGPARPGVGTPVTVEIWIPGAYPHERHRFRVRSSRPGVRSFDPEIVETKGDLPTQVRFTADSPGPGGVTVEPVR